VKISDAQFGALLSMRDNGPVKAIEIIGAPTMDGKRKAKLECHLMNIATLSRLEAEGLVSVSRTPLPRPRNAVGKAGKPRTELLIALTENGLNALSREFK
jgi:hypothetical protein